MYDPRPAVGDYFEEQMGNVFDLERIDPGASGSIPDLISKDGSFFVEVKASAYDNGGVIKKTQLNKFGEETNMRRFYIFVYHSINRDMQKKYPTEKKLRGALGSRSVYLFPFSIVKARFDNSDKITNPKHDDFIQLRESQAKKIFDRDIETWESMKLKPENYTFAHPHEKVYLVTREGYLEKEILSSFHPEFL